MRNPSRISRTIHDGELKIMAGLILVILGGAIGSMWRYWWSGFVAQRLGETFPFGTLVVNTVGSTLIGVFAGAIARVSSSAEATLLQQFLMIGVCGGLTTFSSFSLQTYNLFAEGRWLSALANILFSTAVCLGCVAMGWRMTQW
jgi:CrcB protein